MKLQDKTLENWFRVNARKASADPLLASYVERYDNVAKELNTWVHSEVTKGAISKDGGYLTDHGPDHIATVIRRATMLADCPGCSLKPYEVYLLLMAAHFHDVGNHFGRDRHEAQARLAMDWLGTAGGRDAIENKMILQIAGAHGGKVNGDKDTIGYLQNATTVLGREIRPQYLAAILRFADELADDRQRASRFGLATGSLPPKAQIYHAYAHALHSVGVHHSSRSITLAYELTEEDAAKQYEGSYLLDEIFARTLKMHAERMYCMRFMRPEINIDGIDVRIEVFGQGLSPVEVIAYRLREAGYPMAAGDIHAVCPELTQDQGWDGRHITGAALAQRIKQRSENAGATH